MSQLEDLYREVILDHYRSPRNRGELECPPAHRAEGFNPLCGDDVVVYLDLEDDKIKDLKIGGQGCSISQSSASMMSGAVKGKTLEEVSSLSNAFKELMGVLETDENAEKTPEKVSLGDLEALKGVVKFPVRIKCALLGWNTLLTGIDDIKASK